MTLDPYHRSRQPAEHYNPQVHITAAALRKKRLFVPPSVPDRAWISKAAVRPRTDKQVIEGRDAYYLTAEFLEPFQVDGGPLGEGDDPFADVTGDAARRAQGAILLGPKGEPLPRRV
jgi:hypothetical protein